MKKFILIILSILCLVACGGISSDPIAQTSEPLTVQCGGDTLKKIHCGSGVGGHSWAARIPHPFGNANFIWADARYAKCVPGSIPSTFHTLPYPSINYSIQDGVWDCGGESELWYHDIAEESPNLSILSYQCATIVPADPFTVELDHIDVASTALPTGVDPNNNQVLGWQKFSMSGSQLCVAIQSQFPSSNPTTWTHVWLHGPPNSWYIDVKDAALDGNGIDQCVCTIDEGLPGNPNYARTF